MSILRKDLTLKPTFTIEEIKAQAKLDQNESPYDLPLDLKEKIGEECKRLAWNRYPQPKFYHEVKESFAELIGIKPQNLFLGVGCDQMIFTAFLVVAGKNSLVFEPTYPMFYHYAILTQSKVNREFLGPEYEIKSQNLTGSFDLITIVSPNNPTGNLQKLEIIKLALRKNALVFVDEAYYDFSGFTTFPLLDEFSNLFIGRSLSKSLLAGVHLGYGIAREDLIQLAEEIHFVPYHLNLFSLLVLKYFGEIYPVVKEKINGVNEERERIYKIMLNLTGIKPYKSHANFILFKVEDKNKVFSHLIKRGIRVRDVSGLPSLQDHLRVTIGTKEENKFFLEALQEVSIRS